MNKQQPITRTAVATIDTDKYGNLKFTDTEGNQEITRHVYHGNSIIDKEV